MFRYYYETSLASHYGKFVSFIFLWPKIELSPTFHEVIIAEFIQQDNNKKNVNIYYK